MFYSPTRTALFGLLVWAIFWIAMPVVTVGSLDPGAMLYIALSYLAMFGGVAIAQRGQASPAPDPTTVWQRPLSMRLFWSTGFLGVIGVALRVMDRLLLRGIDYSVNALELREALSETSTSAAGILAAVLLPFCLIPMMLLLASSERRNRVLLAIAAVIFILPTAESFFQLSRSYMLLTIGIAFATVSITLFGGRLLNRRLILVSLLGAVAVTIVSTTIFSARIEAGSRQLSDSVFDSAYAEFLQPNEFAWTVMASGSDIESYAMLSLLPNGLYYLSGAYEFSALWDRPDEQQFAYGQLLFYPFVRVAYRLAGVDFLNAFDVETYVYRDGLYQTFFGPMWSDFGWFGPLLMIGFGILAQTLSNKVRQGSVAFLPLYVYIIIVIYFMPVVNFLTNGFGMLSITTFSVFAAYCIYVERSDNTGAEPGRELAA